MYNKIAGWTCLNVVDADGVVIDIYGSRTGKGGQLQKDERFYTVGSDNRENIVCEWTSCFPSL